MNERLKKVSSKLKESWSKWSIVQKAILAGIVIAVIVAVVVLVRTSATPSGTRLFARPISDQEQLENIENRLEQENVKYTPTAEGYILVDDDRTARKVKSILYTEGLIPTGMDAWDVFDSSQNNWTMTDIERNTNKQRAITNLVRQQIEAFDGVAKADVVITFPEKEIFSENQKPTTTSVVLTFKPGSTMAQDRKKIEGVQKIILAAVSGLSAENLVISDRDGNVLNDFEGMANLDEVNVTEKEQKLVRKMEADYRNRVLEALRGNFSEDRVRDVVVHVDFDLVPKYISDKTIYSPFVMTEQDPTKPYDTSVKQESVTLSSQKIEKTWTGTGYNPEGPAGVEGQNPPVYSDMSNVIGKSTETGVTENKAINTEQRHTEVRKTTPDRITAAVNIDGHWETETDGSSNPIFVTEKNIESLKEKYPDWESGENIRFKLGHIIRVYTPVSKEKLSQAEGFVKNAIGFSQSRGDSVSVTSWAIPRENEWDAEDAAIIRRQQMRRTVMLVLAGILIILISFIIFRFVSRELERRRRLREEEILRKQREERERALWDAKNEGMEVTMSVEERKRAELQENAIAMAKEHPEDVAMLIRTWLMEE